MPHHSLTEGIFVLTLPPPTPCSAFRRLSVPVCFSTSVTAKMPMRTGIISSPAINCVEPNVMRCTAYIVSCPTQARSSPSRPEITVRRMFLESRQVRMDSPMNVMAKISAGLKESAACVNCGESRSIQNADTSPPMAELPSAMPSAFPASPRWAMG